MISRKWFSGAVVSALMLFAALPARAGIPVIDGSNLAQQIQQVLSWGQQAQQMIDQINKLQQQYQQSLEALKAQAAAIAVEQSINIPPTLNKHHGELVSIFVARDLDFSGIYRLRVTEPRNRILDRAVLGDFAPQSTIVTK